MCGSRTWAYAGPDKYNLTEPAFDDGKDAQIIRSMLTGLAYETMYRSDPFVVIEGGATGADSVAWDWIISRTQNVFVHEQYMADWATFGKRAGFLRNQRMLVEGKPELVLAFMHKPSTGTTMMLDMARTAGVSTYVIS